MGKKHSKNWAEIQQDFNSMAEMSCIPSGIKNGPVGAVESGTGAAQQ